MARKPKLEVVPESKSGLEASVDDYMAEVRAKGRALTTENYYANVLRKVWLPWCREHDISDCDQLDQRALDEFNAYLLHDRETPLERSSVASYLRAVRTWLAWTERHELTGGLTLRQVKPEQKILDTLSRDEISKLEAATAYKRDGLMIRLLADTGIRLAELLALKPTSLIELGRDRFLKIQGKGSKERLVPLTPSLYHRLKQYIKDRPEPTNTDRIFVSLRPKEGVYEKLDPRAVQQLLQVVAYKAGITKPTNPHAFRHAFATHALRRGMNVVSLQQALGHADLGMISRVYSHLVAEDIHRDVMRVLGDD